jgi:molybdopterin biosynthesis enzyme
MAADSETQRIAALTPLADLLASFDMAVLPVAPRECALSDALGRTLAADAAIGADHPGVATALRDGFAVRSGATLDASSYAPAPLSPAPPRIDLGEPLPAGADAVALLDDVRMQGHATALAAVAPGEGVLPVAADAAAGAVLRPAGARLRRIDVAALTALGVERVMIREPRVRVVRAGPGAIIAGAAGFIGGAIDAEGAIAIADGHRLENAVQLDDADAVVGIGGTGAGRHDTTVRTLAQVGRVACHGVGILPGETTALGFVGERPVLLLPGRLDAALAGWLTVGRRVLAKLCLRMVEEQPFHAELGRKVASPLGLAEVVPVRRRGFKVEPLASSYLPLSALSRAEGWILVPADSEGHPAGAMVAVRPWP